MTLSVRVQHGAGMTLSRDTDVNVRQNRGWLGGFSPIIFLRMFQQRNSL